MLACARIGAIHSVVFGGFSAESLRDRINDQGAKLARDGGRRLAARQGGAAEGDFRRGALGDAPTIENVVVVRRTGSAIGWTEGRDRWWGDLMRDASAQCAPEVMDAEDPLYILYTSGTTGKPKGILHTTGGYLVGTYATSKWVFDLKDEDVYWCTADIGWVTGHSYVVYGPLANGATCLMYEGAPDTPARDRFWDIVERHGVTILYTAPTAIRAFMKWGTEWPGKHDLSSLRLLGSGRRADQPRGLDLVPREHRQRPLPDRGHLVADGDRNDPDHAAARHHDDAPGLGDASPSPGIQAKIMLARGRQGGAGRRRISRDHAALAGDAPHDLGRRPPVRRDLLVEVGAEPLLPGRRRPARPEGVFLASRPRGRRHERRGPPDRHDGGRIGPRGSPGRGRGGGGRGDSTT